MKLKMWALPLLCFGLVALFAGSALAQEEQAAPDQGAATQPLRLPLPRQANSFNRGASSSAQTQQQMKSEAVGSDNTSDCTYTFTSGSGPSYLQFCVTVNGNIAEFQSPVNVDQIRQGGIAEGYGICDVDQGAQYWDYADEGDSGNWQAPTTVAHTASMVKIERTTIDGLWTLTQTITSVPGTNPSARVLMALKNNSSIMKEAYLIRFADVDPGNPADTDTNFNEEFAAGGDSAWGWVYYFNGLMFQTIGNPNPVSALKTRFGSVLDTHNGPKPCAGGGAVLETDVDGSIYYFWDLNLNEKQSVSVTGRYMSF